MDFSWNQQYLHQPWTHLALGSHFQIVSRGWEKRGPSCQTRAQHQQVPDGKRVCCKRQPFRADTLGWKTRAKNFQIARLLTLHPTGFCKVSERKKPRSLSKIGPMAIPQVKESKSWNANLGEMVFFSKGWIDLPPFQCFWVLSKRWRGTMFPSFCSLLLEVFKRLRKSSKVNEKHLENKQQQPSNSNNNNNNNSSKCFLLCICCTHVLPCFCHFAPSQYCIRVCLVYLHVLSHLIFRRVKGHGFDVLGSQGGGCAGSLSFHCLHSWFCQLHIPCTIGQKWSRTIRVVRHGKDQKARMAGETRGTGMLFLFSAQYSPKEKAQGSLFTVVRFIGCRCLSHQTLKLEWRVAKLIGRNFMRHIALSKRNRGRGLACLQLWHLESLPQIPGKVQRSLFLLGMERFVAFVCAETLQYLGPPQCRDPCVGPVHLVVLCWPELCNQTCQSSFQVFAESHSDIFILKPYGSMVIEKTLHQHPFSHRSGVPTKVNGHQAPGKDLSSTLPAVVIAHQYLWHQISVGSQLFPTYGSTLLPRMELVITKVAACTSMMPFATPIQGPIKIQHPLTPSNCPSKHHPNGTHGKTTTSRFAIPKGRPSLSNSPATPAPAAGSAQNCKASAKAKRKAWKKKFTGILGVWRYASDRW